VNGRRFVAPAEADVTARRARERVCRKWQEVRRYKLTVAETIRADVENRELVPSWVLRAAGWPPRTEERTMPKYLLLKHYNGGPEPMPGCVPMSEWTEDEITAHIAFQHEVGRMLRDSGEFVDAQGLSPEGTYVRYGGPDSLPVTDGPFPEAKELIAGWYVVDVDSEQRAHEIAAHVSSAPGRGGAPIYEWIEVRPIMDAVPASTE
jgi:hypothetical protein